MMRDLKFRAKRIDNGEWVYGSYAIYSENEGYILVRRDDWFNTIKVNPDTVCQFTGFHDKYGKEIYDCDILRLGDTDSGVCVVRWNDAAGAFCIRFYYEQELGDRPVGLWLQIEHDVVVIDNTIDRQEDLK